jgi:hypothetical protein
VYVSTAGSELAGAGFAACAAGTTTCSFDASFDAKERCDPIAPVSPFIILLLS